MKIVLPVKTCKTAIAVFIVFFLNSALANEDGKGKPNMREITVTGHKPISVINVPRNVDIFTANDIEQSGASTVPELLSRLANISLVSFSGNSKTTRIDIRGSGDTSVSNVLILVDGIRLNTPDLAGADFATLNIHQIERIEVIRGANSVRFGSGASQGVINIFTKQPEKSHVALKLERGSLGENNETLTTVGVLGNHALLLQFDSTEEDGYRENNTYSAEDYLIDYKGSLKDKDDADYLTLSLKAKKHDDDYELPGPISDDTERTLSTGSNLIGITTDKTESLFLDYSPNDTFSFVLNGARRKRENDFLFDPFTTFFLPDGLLITNLDNFGQRILLETNEINTYILFEPSHLPLEIELGYSYLDSDYQRFTQPYVRPNASSVNTEFVSKAFYSFLRWDIIQQLNMNIGYRKQTTDNKSFGIQLFSDKNSPDCFTRDLGGGPFLVCPDTFGVTNLISEEWVNEAYEFNLVYQLAQDSAFYISAAETFRLPNGDEFGLRPTATTPEALTIAGILRPQSTERYEAGIKQQIGITNISATYFTSHSTDEVIFARVGDAQVNHNFPDPIKRKGFEIHFSASLPMDLELDLNYGTVKARINKDRTVPLVPKRTANINVNWSPSKLFNVNWNTRYVDERNDGLDFSIGDSKNDLKSHTVTDINLSLHLKTTSGLAIRHYLSINNAFNELYNNASYGGSFYPANERSTRFGIEIIF